MKTTLSGKVVTTEITGKQYDDIKRMFHSEKMKKAAKTRKRPATAQILERIEPGGCRKIQFDSKCDFDAMRRRISYENTIIKY